VKPAFVAELVLTRISELPAAKVSELCESVCMR
jgi:hypothetical protein